MNKNILRLSLILIQIFIINVSENLMHRFISILYGSVANWFYTPCLKLVSHYEVCQIIFSFITLATAAQEV